jgi:hypothetical protein
MQENLLSLDDVKAHFEHWRSTRTKQREKIPQYLWDEVKILLDRYLLSDITTALRVNTSQIKYNLKINTKINFAEAHIDISNSPHQSYMSFLGAEQTCAIELHRANGNILKINSLPIISIQKIISQFME